MLRRSIYELSSRRVLRRIPTRVTTQIPLHLSTRKEFSVASNGLGSTGKPSGSGSNLSKAVIGGVALGAAVLAAYQTGHLDKLLTREPHSDVNRESQELLKVRQDTRDGEPAIEPIAEPTQEPSIASLNIEHPEKSSETSSSSSNTEGENDSQTNHISGLSATKPEDVVEDNELASSPQSSLTSDNDDKQWNTLSTELSKELDIKSPEVTPTTALPQEVERTPIFTQTSEVITKHEIKPEPPQHFNTQHLEEDTVSNGINDPSSLLDEYLLLEKTEESAAASSNEHKSPVEAVKDSNNVYIDKDGKLVLDFLQAIHTAEKRQAELDARIFAEEKRTMKVSNGINGPSSLLDEYLLLEKTEESAAASSNEHKSPVEAVKDSNDVYIDKDGKLVLDFLQAIHTAEKKQAELDARIFAEEKRTMKEKYEKELKDARARELVYAEREAILDKELNKEKIKAAAALKSLQEKLDEKHRMEIEQKEAEAELELHKMQELAKAELAAKIASEKAAQIEKMADANLYINALCMAFFARSEEARQSHSVHKLALGALALEDALSRGLPLQKEINALHTHLEGIDKGSLLDLVLSSLPEETLIYGTANVLQLNQKFDALKGTLRHFSLIPPGGGGLLAHSLARVASFLKAREAGQSGDGIESLINRVESFLAEGKLLEAADTLEDGLKGSQAAEIVGDWVRQARNRAITERALTLLQSYATSLSLT